MVEYKIASDYLDRTELSYTVNAENISAYFSLLKSVFFEHGFEEHPERCTTWMRLG